jgi:hypothetical protein
MPFAKQPATEARRDEKEDDQQAPVEIDVDTRDSQHSHGFEHRTHLAPADVFSLARTTTAEARLSLQRPDRPALALQ